MNENEFIAKLQAKAREQELILQTAPFPKFFAFVVNFLSHHPWRYLIPLAFIISLILRGIFGMNFTNFILDIFRSHL
ncbi:MAG TPA: hypothetical protein VF810_04275 [Patescibacteria group bacterium]